MFQAQYYLTKTKINLEETGRRLSEIKIRLDNESTRLGNLCKTKEAQEKIALLAADILRKNLKIGQPRPDLMKHLTNQKCHRPKPMALLEALAVFLREQLQFFLEPAKI